MRTFGCSRVQETLRQALAELAAASEREYLNDASDREAAARYYADVDPDLDPAALFAALGSCGAAARQGRSADPFCRASPEREEWPYNRG